MSEAIQTETDPNSVALEDINVSDPNLFMTDSHWGYRSSDRHTDSSCPLNLRLILCTTTNQPSCPINPLLWQRRGAGSVTNLFG